MPWLQLTLEATPDDAERIADALSELGAGAVTLQDGADQPLYEPPPGATPLWSATRVVGLFDAGADMERLVVRLTQALGLKTPPPWRVSPLEDKDWEREWMVDFKPMRFGEHLWICPSWCEPPDLQAVNILLDPGLAFGTGTHPTTALCLEWLDGHGARYDQVIDYGCGSGILAVAAAKLGAQHIWAVDNDPQALIATRDNAAKNEVSAAISAVAPAGLPAQHVPLLLANILAQPLIDLAGKFADLVAPGGHIVLSGILQPQAAQVMAAYAPNFVMEAPVYRDEWTRLCGVRRDTAV